MATTKRHASFTRLTAPPSSLQRRGTPTKLQPLRDPLASVGSSAALSGRRRNCTEEISTWFDELPPDAYNCLRQMGFPDERIKRARQHLSGEGAAGLPHTFDNVLQALFEKGTCSPASSRPPSAAHASNQAASTHETSLIQMGFPSERVTEVVRTLGECSLDKALEELLLRDSCVADNAMHANSSHAPYILEGRLDQPMHGKPHEALHLLGDISVLESLVDEIAAKNRGISPCTVRHNLLLIDAGLKQNLISSEAVAELHNELAVGSLDIVQEFLSLTEVRYSVGIPLEDCVSSWECQICFSEYDTCGWRCQEGRHQFCHECMRHHVEAVAYPTCPFVGCKFKLEEADFIALESDPVRLRRFRESQLHNAVNALGCSQDHESEVVIHCQGSNCTNAIVVSSSAERSCFACPCGYQPICTKCRSAYHYHVDCTQVQELRQAWLNWITEGRLRYFRNRIANDKYARDLLEFGANMKVWHSQLKALRDSIERQKELHGDEVWKSKHCRLCPGCKRPLEKTGGCNAMICGRDAHGGNEQRGCGTKFDWSTASPYVPATQRFLEDLPDKPKHPRKQFALRGFGVFHPFSDCSVCGHRAEGIAGLQFRCVHCDNFRVCEDCEKTLPENHDSDHVFEIMYESDFDWSHIRFRAGTPVRFVRNKGRMPCTEPQLENDLEGTTGTVVRSVEMIRGSLQHRIAVSRGLSDFFWYDIALGDFVGRVSSEFLEPLISSRYEAEQSLASQDVPRRLS